MGLNRKENGVRLFRTQFTPTFSLYAFVFEPRDEPTDVRPAPERDRPTEGCQLAVLGLRRNTNWKSPEMEATVRDGRRR